MNSSAFEEVIASFYNDRVHIPSRNMYGVYLIIKMLSLPRCVVVYVVTFTYLCVRSNLLALVVQPKS